MAFDFARHRQQALASFAAVRPRYERFAEVVRHVLRSSIPASCPIHSIQARAKGVDQFADKACKAAKDQDQPKYPSPMTDITDLAGVRVITFFPRNIIDVERAVQGEFVVTERTDKGEELLADGRFGYQSIHYLVQLRPSRTALPEYKDFDGLIAEVQVRTILQHAWAEMEHDIQYKSVSAIPSTIRRRFMSLAGMLEIADREFQAIQDADAALRDEVRLPLDAELTADVGVRVDAPTPDLQIASLEDSDAPDTKTYVRGSARALLLSGYYTEAVKAYDAAISQHPTGYTHYLGRARARFLAGDQEGALADVRRADELQPGEPAVRRLRAQIEEGAVASPEEQSLAQRETYEGNRLVAAGDAEGALKHYLLAEEHGWHWIHSQFNKAIAACLAGRRDDMERYLANLKVRPGTVYGVTSAAVQTIAAKIAEDEQADRRFEDLQEQLKSVPSFSFARSHLRYLEEGLAASSAVASGRASSVFALLRAAPGTESTKKRHDGAD